MKESSQLIEKNKAAEDGRVQLDRPLAPYPAYPQYDAYPQDSSGYNRLHEYWRSVRKHLWLVLSIIAVVTAVTTIYMARQPDIFESMSRVQVDLETANNPAIGALKGNSIYLNNPLQDPTYFNTQIQILTSAGLLGRVAKTLDLEHNQAFLHPQAAQNHSVWESVKRLWTGGKSQPEANAVEV